MTKLSGPSAPECPPDHARDHGRDHVTKPAHGHASAAEDLLKAVEKGESASVELAGALAAIVLSNPLVRRARELEVLLEARSPFALVRAVELAEEILRVAREAGVGEEGVG